MCNLLLSFILKKKSIDIYLKGVAAATLLESLKLSKAWLYKQANKYIFIENESICVEAVALVLFFLLNHYIYTKKNAAKKSEH